MKKVYIVTGANGFLGNTVVKKLSGEREVRALVLPGDELHSLNGANCSIYEGDVTKPETLSAVFDGLPADADVCVIHCAAVVYTKSKYDKRVYDVNVNGTKNIAEKVLEKNAKLVYVSSVHAIPEKPENEIITETADFDSQKVKGLYAKTKAEAAAYVLRQVKENGLNACILHPSGIIGPNDYGRSHLTQLITDYLSGKLRLCVKGGYDFADVRDVADGVINACELGEKGECYILSNRYVRIKELLDGVSEITGIKKPGMLPMWLARMTAPLAEKYYDILKQPPLYSRYSLYTISSNSNFSCAKAREKLNYKTRDFKQTLKDTVEWLSHRSFAPCYAN